MEKWNLGKKIKQILSCALAEEKEKTGSLENVSNTNKSLQKNGIFCTPHKNTVKL